MALLTTLSIASRLLPAAGVAGLGLSRFRQRSRRHPGEVADEATPALRPGRRELRRLIVGGMPSDTLTDVDLRQADLAGLDLTTTPLAGLDLTGACLRRVQLRGADLSATVLDHADLSQADLRGAILDRVSLIDADLSRADLDGADLSQTRNLRTATLRRSTYTRTTRWPGGFDPDAAGATRLGLLR